MQNTKANLNRFVRIAAILLVLGASLALFSTRTPHAQHAHEPEVKVTGVNSRSNEKESVVTISADGNLARAQTWQDRQGFHVVLPRGQTELRNSAGARNVKIERVGDSLEFIVPVKPGASVTVQPRFNRLDLVVNGQLDESNDTRAESKSQATDAQASTQETRVASASQAGVERASRTNVRQQQAGALASAAAERAASLRSKSSSTLSQSFSMDAPHASAPVAPVAPAQTGNAPAATTTGSFSVGDTSMSQSVAQASGAETAKQSKTATARPAQNSRSNGGTAQESSLLFSSTGLLGLVGVAGAGALLFVFRRRRNTEASESNASQTKQSQSVQLEETLNQSSSKSKQKEKRRGRETSGAAAFEQSKGDRRKNGDRRMIARNDDDRRKSGVGAEPQSARHAQGEEESIEDIGSKTGGKLTRVSSGSSLPAVLYGAYRIDMEIGKLLAGEPHSIEVLASRATDDRRAIETSLIKAIRSPEADDTIHRRAQRALEEYGFVARQSATLLLASEAFERASAARVLGEVRASTALPFLLEALYDPETVVRSEVVSSLGALRMPRAIGALIDMARRYPEMPATLLRPVLSACSVDSPEPVWEDAQESQMFFTAQTRELFTGEIAGLEPPQDVEQLPEWLENETLADALERLSSTDIEARIVAAQKLAQFQVQRSVEALAAMASQDCEAAVRAAAVNSLGVVDHESVFAPVLMAMGDEAREVRAAAARSLSRLSFDRADAYVRVIEKADAETRRAVALACIKAGLAAQALDRLTSEDRRQAYEAFSLLSLVVKAGEVSIVLEAIVQHTDLNVRLAALKLLCMMGRPAELVEPLRRLTARDRLPEKVRAALVEAITGIERGESAMSARSDEEQAFMRNGW